MLKQLNRSDKTLRPFNTFKHWVIDTTNNDSVILTEDGKQILSYFNTSSYGQYYGSGSLAIQHQTYHDQQYQQEGLKVDGIFYDTTDPWYNSGSNPLNWNNTYKRMVYSTIDHMFYKYSDNAFYTFGVEKSDAGKNGESENRVIHDRVSSINIVQNVYGQKIRPTTYKIEDYSYRDDVYYISDDGYTNLKFNDVYFGHMDHIQPVSRSAGMDYLYDVSSERFGSKVASWGQYILFGAPKDEFSLSDDKNGKATLYRMITSSKIDEIEYRYIREFESPFTQNGFSIEQTWDYSDNILNELGFYLLPEGESITNDEFGNAITINDNYLAIGSATADYSGNASGSGGQVYVHDKYKGGFDHWGIINILEGSSSGDRFGSAVHLSGSKLAVGADNAYGSKGAAYVFERFVYGDTLPTSSFWYRIAPEDFYVFNFFQDNADQIIQAENNPSYFIEGDSVWVLQHVITSSLWTSGSRMGGSIKLNGNKLFVGSKQNYSASAVSIFEYDINAVGTGIYDTSSFEGPDSNLAYGTGSWVNTYTITNTGVYSGSVFTSHSVNLERENYFFPTYVSNLQLNKDGFGTAIDSKGNNLVIGSPYDSQYYEYSGSPVNYKAGAVYILQYTQSNWVCKSKVFGREDDSVNNLFGIDVSINTNRIAVGSPLTPYSILDYWNTSSMRFEIEGFENGAFNASSKNYYCGETFLYKLNVTQSWSYEKSVKRVKYHHEPKSLYGNGVSLTDDLLIVGSPVVSYTNTTNLDSKFIRENVPFILTGSAFTYPLKDLDNVYQVGNVFYKTGIVTNTLTASLFKDIFQGNIRERNDLFGYSMSFQNTHQIHENEIMCSVDPGEFNVSTNPTSLKYYPIIYDVANDGIFSLKDAKLIYNYIIENYGGLRSGSLLPPERPIDQAIGMSTTSSWWKDDLILLESEDAILLESYVYEPIPTGSIVDYYEAVRAIDAAGYLDVNLDGKVDVRDANLIIRYFLGYGGIKLTKDCVDFNCERRYDYQIREFLDSMTGKLNGRFIKEEFLSYSESSSLDKTGSYLAPYCSQVGLYEDGVLVAIAKLGKPIKIDGSYPITFNVKYDSF